jgi:hypothetical protein
MAWVAGGAGSKVTLTWRAIFGPEFVAGNIWPGVAKEQHERFSLPIVATNV